MLARERQQFGNWRLGPVLGQGHQAGVQLGTHAVTGRPAALKVIDAQNLNPNSLRNVQREVAAMGAITHPNVIQILEVHWNVQYPRRDGIHQPVHVLAVELAQGGELFDFLKLTGAFPESIARAYFYQLLTALAATHEAGIAHRDIKPENLLLDHEFRLKVADFGLANSYADEAGKVRSLLTHCGTRMYMAPELLAAEAYQGPPADLWSAGVVLFIMLAGAPPFSEATGADWWYCRIREGRHQLFWQAHLRSNAFSEGAMEYLNLIFDADPAKRPSAAELLAHPWMAGAHVGAPGLAAQMRQRKAEVDARERERLQAARAANPDYDDHDVFAVDIARGSAADDGKAPPVEDEDAAHGAVGGVRRFTYFYSDLPARDLQHRLRDALDGMTAAVEAEGDDDYSLRVSARVDDQEVSFVVLTNSLPAHPGVHIVRVSRLDGGLFKFQKAYRRLYSDMGSAVCGPPPST